MNWKVIIFWSMFIAVAVIRVYLTYSIERPDIGTCLKQSVNGFGSITEQPSSNESGQIIVVRAQNIESGDIECAGGVLIRMKTKLYPKFLLGDLVQFGGKLYQPFNFQSSDGRYFDFKGYLAKDDIYFEIKSAQVIALKQDERRTSTTTVSNESRSIFEKLPVSLYRLKRSFVSNLEHVLGEPHAGLAAGLVVGEKSSLGKELLADFRTVGLIHIVVLSGFNITIVADALRRLLVFLPRVWGIVVGGIGIALFCVLVGGGATVVRSCAMAGIALSADLIRRDYDVVRALIFAGLIMIIQNPMILSHDPSFQLSFLATLGLITFSSSFEKRLGWITERFGLRGIIASTFATQVFVSPYILYTMGQVSIIGVVVNILVLPFIPITMLAVFMTGAFGFILPSLSQAIGWLSHILLSYELFIVEYFAKIPFAYLQVPTFSIWWVVGFYLLIAAFVTTRYYKAP